MRTRKRIANNPHKGMQLAHRVCIRNRAVAFKESEAEETIPTESIPLIEEIMADLLFASWVNERGVPANSRQTQNEEKTDESNLAKTNLTA